MHKINLDVFHQNQDYHNFINFTSLEKAPLEPFLDLLDTNGDVWNRKDDYFPLIISKVMKNHNNKFKGLDTLGQEIDRHFLFRTFVNNSNNESISDDDFKWVVEMLAEKSSTKALMFTHHDNPYVKHVAESLIKGAFEDYEFTVSETHFGESDRIILDDENK